MGERWGEQVKRQRLHSPSRGGLGPDLHWGRLHRLWAGADDRGGRGRAGQVGCRDAGGLGWGEGRTGQKDGLEGDRTGLADDSELWRVRRGIRLTPGWASSSWVAGVTCWGCEGGARTGRRCRTRT